MSEKSSCMQNDKLIRLAALLSGACSMESYSNLLVAHSLAAVEADVCCFYRTGRQESDSFLYKVCAYGQLKPKMPDKIQAESSLTRFIRDCREMALINKRTHNSERLFLQELLIDNKMHSGAGLPVFLEERLVSLLLLLSRKPCYFVNQRYEFLDSLSHLIRKAPWPVSSYFLLKKE